MEKTFQQLAFFIKSMDPFQGRLNKGLGTPGVDFYIIQTSGIFRCANRGRFRNNGDR